MTVSFEFFPPNNGNFSRVGDHLVKLLRFAPKFLSVTFGAGGSAEDKSLELIRELRKRSPTKVIAHLTLVDKTKDKVNEISGQFRELGIETILAVRGDSPSQKYKSREGGFKDTSEFVNHLKHQGFDVFVSAYAEPHPESPNIEHDLELLKKKADAGATSAITQFCFDLDKLADLKNVLIRDNVALELIPGVMPVRNIENLKRMADRCGIKIPKDIGNGVHIKNHIIQVMKNLGVIKIKLINQR